ncbi:hypothetical protein MKW98_027242 [Papaver atlanticum]|uniref:Uncharacterized protein n=1 Tax=Papaver atlanticum TaxID=357466 RepID=A0AAD4XJ06_9MAGN|nr:hypothetical protein MKW98_027242 [Papaver atlanticum]
MRCFLKDADAKQQQGDERVRNWVAEIRNIAYDAEDVVDTFILKIDAPAKSGGVLNLITRKALMVKNLKQLHTIGKDIKDIQSRLRVISDSRVTYGINNLSDNEASSSVASQMIQQQLRNHYPHVEDDDTIGLEEHTKTLLTELVKDDERRCVVSIVGVGGLGKTTLAKKIYKDDIVMSRFDCHAWSSISQQFNPGDSLLQLIKTSMNLSDNELSRIKELNMRDLVEKLYQYLQDKRYFVVLDDLWSFEDWNTLSPAFPNGKKGSKVLLTTRNREVASQADPWSLQLEPRLLNEEDSWELLCKKAFPKNIGDANVYPAGLEKLGREMVRKCGGLPLAICVLGGLLAAKKSEIKEWEYVNRDITSNINKGKNGCVMGILELSYNDLPVHLKPCFLYLGLFPEDHAIPRKKLIQLWISEGFIPHMKEDALATPEDIGKHQYYAELIQRCMIQPEKDTNPWRKKACRMHDLMRDLCLLKAKEMNFADVSNDHTDGITLNSSSTDTCRRLRRYAIHLNDQEKRYDDLYFNNSTSALRTLLVDNPRGNPLSPLKYQNIKLLRVLDLENARNFSSPNTTKEVTKLVHLRYLALGKGQLDIPIPSSIGNLRNLQTLKLSFRGLLPDTITNCVQLRHLEMVFGEVPDSFQIENLIKLQFLSNVKAGKWIRKGCLGKPSKLRNLSVKNISRTQTAVLINEIADKKSSSSDDQYQNPIRVLRLQSNGTFENKIFDSLSCCHNLYRLQLNGKLDVLNLQKYPPNLSKLTLDENMLNDDPMKTLQYLPKLKSLVMHRTYTGEEMECSTKGFPQLQVLIIFGFDRLKKWTVEQGGMPRLKELHLNVLPELRMLPEGLRFMTTLEKLRINSHMPTIRDRVVREIGEDWYKVQHIPSIKVSNY